MAACSRCGEQNPSRAQYCLACGTALGEPRSPVEVRKTVTVLFCDVTGSTAFGEQQDPEQVRRVMSRYFERARTVLERHGGTVEKFIGDAVVSVFGVPMLHEDDALRALRAAAELRDAIDDLNRELEDVYGVRIDVRIGVNSGEVIAFDSGTGEGYASGDAVNVAQRLESAAAPGEILLGGATHGLARDAIRAEPVGPLAVKGRAEPVVAYRLLEVLPGMPSHARRLDSPIVGRERELRLLADAFDRCARERTCHLFTVLGTAGIGKSRLVREALDAVGEDARVIAGACLPYGEGITFWPALEVVKQATGIVDGDSSAEALAKIEAALGEGESLLDATALAAERVAGLIGLSAMRGGAEEGFWGFRKLLESVAKSRPLVVVIDDLHWAEPKLLDLLDHVAEASREAPILLLCLARPELLEARATWGGGKRNASSIFLEPLSRDESRRLLANLLGGDVGDDALARIHSFAEGNPLFVEEMVSMLVDGGLLHRNGGSSPHLDLDDVSVPDSIQVLLASRLDQLGADERVVLERGAVEGTAFHRGAVAALSDGEPVGQIDDCLESLVRKELIRPHRASFAGEDAFRFRHVLIREAAYEALPKHVRANLHERFAVWLEDIVRRDAEVEELLGFHLEQAYRYRVELARVDERARAIAVRAVVRLGAAGKRALGRGDTAAAVNLLERALALVDEKAEGWLELAVELGIALRESADFRRADRVLGEVFDLARKLGDRRHEVVALVQRAEATVLSDPAQADEVLSAVEAAVPVLEELGESRTLATAWMLLGQFRGLGSGRFAFAEEAYGRALEHARDAGDRREEANSLRWLALAGVWGPLPVEHAITRCAAMLDGAHGDPVIEVGTLRSLSALEGRRGRFDEGRSLAARARHLCDEIGIGGLLPTQLAVAVGEIELLAECYDAAEAALRRASDALERMGERGFRSTAVAIRARALYGQGRIEEAEACAREALADAPISDIFTQSLAKGTLATVCARRGEHAEAEALAREGVALLEPTDALDLSGSALADLADVLATAGRHEEARQAREEALRLFEQKGNLASAARLRRIMASAPSRDPVV